MNLLRRVERGQHYEETESSNVMYSRQIHTHTHSMHAHTHVPLSVVSVVLLLCSSEEGSSPLADSLKQDNSGILLLKIKRKDS